MNGVMLPLLNLFGSNFAFFVDNKEKVKSFNFIDFTLLDYEFSPMLRLKKREIDEMTDLSVEMKQDLIVSFGNVFYYLVKLNKRTNQYSLKLLPT